MQSFLYREIVSRKVIEDSKRLDRCTDVTVTDSTEM